MEIVLQIKIKQFPIEIRSKSKSCLGFPYNAVAIFLRERHIPIEFISKDSDEYLVTNRIGSTEKAKSELGVEVDVSLENGLKQVIDWKLGQLT